MTDAKSLTTPRNALPFGGDFEQVFNRMMRGWPFGWPEMAPSRAHKAVRAFDPCLSCATHAMGRMPLAVELRDASGELVDSRVRG